MDEINWNLRKYTKEQFIEAWNKGASLREVSQLLGLKGVSRDSFAILEHTALSLGLEDYPTGKRSDIKDTRFSWTIETIFIIHEDKSPNSLTIKKHLIEQGFKEYVCEVCDTPSWNGAELSLHLDHINGNNKDNRLENLRFLCPNCHSQTETFGNKDRKIKVKDVFIPTIPLRRSYRYAFHEVFAKNTVYSSKKVRTRIINECLLPYECFNCDIDEYNGMFINLQIDHIDGDKSNNELNNLRFLCPNCHSQTDTYCGRNIKEKRNHQNISISYKNTKNIEPSYCNNCDVIISPGAKRCKKCISIEAKRKQKPKFCIECDTPIGSKSTRCRSCAMARININNSKNPDDKMKTIKESRRKTKCSECGKETKSFPRDNVKLCLSCYNKLKSQNVPDKDDLIATLQQFNANFTRVGKHYAVSDNAVRKWCKKYDIPYRSKDLKEYLSELSTCSIPNRTS